MILAVNPLRAARFAQEAADAGVPSLVIPGGGVVEGGEAAAAMQRDGRARSRSAHGIALLGPNCMGVVDWTTNSATTSATSTRGSRAATSPGSPSRAA